jgi:hypothetical protein
MTPKESEIVKEAVLRLLREDFRIDFEQIYSRAVQVSSGFVTLAAGEIQAFLDHCGNALVAQELTQAELDVSRARRHLQQAKYACLDQILNYQIKDAVRRIEEIETQKGPSTLLPQRQLVALQENRDSLEPLSITQRATLGEIQDDVDAAIIINKQLEILVTRVNELIAYLERNFPRSQDAQSSKQREFGQDTHGDRSVGSTANKGNSSGPKTNTERLRRPRTKIGRAVTEHKEQIALLVSAQLALIAERLAYLRAHPPNSPEAIEAVNSEIAHFEEIQLQLQDFDRSAKAGAKDAAEEAKVIEVTKTLAEGVRSWWTKRHEQICERAFEMGLFASAVGVCSLAGAGGSLSVAVSGALIGGKPVVDAIKSVGKSFSKVLLG